MNKRQDIVLVKLDQPKSVPVVSAKVFQIKIGDNKTLVVYNKINGYILETLLKAVFQDTR